MTVHVTFPGLDTEQAADVVAITEGRVLARAAATPGSDGTATVTLTVGHLTPAQPVTVTVRAPHQTCQAAPNPRPHPADPHLPHALTSTGGPSLTTSRPWQLDLSCLADRLQQLQHDPDRYPSASCGFPGACLPQFMVILILARPVFRSLRIPAGITRPQERHPSRCAGYRARQRCRQGQDAGHQGSSIG